MKVHILVLLVCLLTACGSNQSKIATPDLTAIKAPLFIDPNYHGSCDPEVVWNKHKKAWYIYYTSRRATREKGTYVGTPIGVLASKNLFDWNFEGYADFTDAEGNTLNGTKDMPVTFWAPGIIAHKNKLHMYVTYKDNAKPPWAGVGHIRHYIAPLDNPISGWKLAQNPDFAQPDPIDATIVFNQKLNQFHAYYRVAKNGGIQMSTSKDLISWKNKGKVKGDVNTLGKQKFGYQEAPFVFKFKGSWWMLTDPHKGIAVYRSDDSLKWQYSNVILDKPGTRKLDTSRGRHPSVSINNGRAFIFYHVEPNREYNKKFREPKYRSIEQKKSVLQMAELVVENNMLRERRNNY